MAGRGVPARHAEWRCPSAGAGEEGPHPTISRKNQFLLNGKVPVGARIDFDAHWDAWIQSLHEYAGCLGCINLASYSLNNHFLDFKKNGFHGKFSGRLLLGKYT